MTKVSIIVPIYGVEKYIERCARSLLEQTYDNIEYIFVDDCSKDSSIPKLENVISCYPQRDNKITIVKHERNLGLAEARNSGINKATGEFIIHVDSDDYVDHDLVKKAVEAQNRSNSDFVIWDYYVYYGSSKNLIKQKEITTPQRRVISVLKKNDMPCIWCNMIRRSLYTDNSIRNIEGVDYSEDYQVLPQLMYYANKLSYISEPLYYYDCSNTGSYTNTLNQGKMEQLFRTIAVLKRFFCDKDQVFMDAICASEVYSLSQYINVVVLQKNHKTDYLKIQEKWRCLESQHRELLPFWRKILFILPDNIILKIYVQIGSKLHRLFLSIIHKYI